MTTLRLKLRSLFTTISTAIFLTGKIKKEKEEKTIIFDIRANFLTYVFHILENDRFDEKVSALVDIFRHLQPEEESNKLKMVSLELLLNNIKGTAEYEKRAYILCLRYLGPKAALQMLANVIGIENAFCLAFTKRSFFDKIDLGLMLSAWGEEETANLMIKEMGHYRTFDLLRRMIGGSRTAMIFIRITDPYTAYLNSHINNGSDLTFRIFAQKFGAEKTLSLSAGLLGRKKTILLEHRHRYFYE